MKIQEECKSRFESLIANFIDTNSSFENSRWQEIETRYSEPHRTYHNLNHLYQMLGEYDLVSKELKDPEITLFALYYHDLIYDVTSKTNEEESANIAKERLSELTIENERIETCMEHILATKSHRLGDKCHPDTSYFLDIDISILGSEETKYYEYANNIRKEYSIFSDADYQTGRIQVLHHFIENIRLFHTDFFFDRYEMRSRHNVKLEIHSFLKGELI
ncbi:HD domain-containing protein [Leptospira terpstrae]|uniref:HD domain-containing protein n=1 Tax=Leptospira terpstrae TaxID=293075 RepID=UPI003CFE0C7A